MRSASPAVARPMMRRQAISKYSGSRSMPMKVRPRFMQATPVVPLPMKGSRMIFGVRHKRKAPLH